MEVRSRYDGTDKHTDRQIWTPALYVQRGSLPGLTRGPKNNEKMPYCIVKFSRILFTF